MADVRRLVELSMVPPLAKEVAAQINAAGGTPYTDAQARTAIATKTQIAAVTALTGGFGTTSSAIADVTAAFSQTILNNNFRALEDKLNAIIAALKA